MEVIDLHLHTNLSDGLLSPDRVVELAKQKQCKLISITDHEIITDFSDLEERLNYYIEHVDESLEIIRHAHEYVSQFKDKRRENLISLLVLDKYFKMTGQKS